MQWLCFLKRKYPLINILYVQEFLVNCVIFCIFVTTLELKIIVREKNLKNKDIHNASVAFISESMPKFLIFFVKFGS